ncbi:MAG TPA: polysaccharide deacetylase family protein [Candidatus Elarobacter sp.]|nr:polysaccharide deacetylase family protein [Candidatus Elarobacter sp.]
MRSRPEVRRPGLTIAIVAVVLAVAAVGASRLWTKTDDLLRPVVVLRGADARALLHPSLGDRIGALFGNARAPVTARPKLVALTFDDGPYPVTTPLLLQRLRDLRVPATFFLIGRDAEQFPDLARAIAAGGNEIADHTLTHPDLTKLDAAGVTAELRGGAASLEGIAPDPAERTTFRPPHGRFNDTTIAAAQAGGYDTILWSDDPGDWRAVSEAALEEHLLAHATAPEIVLLHSGRPATIGVIGPVVEAFRSAGYRFVTVAALLRQVAPDEINRPAKVSLPR